MFSAKVKFPVEELTPTVLGLREALQANLVSCLLYGSAIRGGLIPKISDLNLLIVLKRSTPEAHELVADRLAGQSMVDPVVVSRGQLKRLFELFPVRFRSIQRNYRVLAGEDPLATHRPRPEMVRFNCEQSLRRLQLEAVHAYLICRNQPRLFLDFLASIEVELYVVLSEMLRQDGIDPPKEFKDRFPLFVEHLNVDETVLDGLLLVKEGRLKLSREQIAKFHLRLTPFLQQVVEWFRRRTSEPTN